VGAEQAVEVGVVVLVGVLLVVAAAAGFGPRIRVPAPLILVLVGIALSVLSPLPDVVIPPELVLTGVLPPLLYASSVSVPAMDLRREFGAVSVLSVVLVIVSALLLGLLFTALIPGLPYALGIALGAVISPTDAVATSIVKRAKVSHRVTAILEGESLLNDASALVLLRAAITGAASLSFLQVTGSFLYSLVVAIVLGVLVGRVTTLIRGRITDPTVNTVLSFTVPFLASLPAELLGASGLVAAVAAGLTVGRRAPRELPAEHRRSDRENWSTVSLVLEGAIFLAMGLQLSRLVNANGGAADGLRALGIALAALVGVLVVRALFVTPLLVWLHRRAQHGAGMRTRLEQVQQAIADGRPIGEALAATRPENERARTPRRRARTRRQRPGDGERFSKRLRQVLGDIDYLSGSPLGPREGAVVVWAGMRGAVTVAAAQTIVGARGVPPEVGDLLVLVAFGVAAISLLLQGGTLNLLIRVLRPRADDPAAEQEEQEKISRLIQETGDAVPQEEGESRQAWALRRVVATRAALLDARDEGVFSSEVLGRALDAVDATEIAIDARSAPAS
jgi:CPA1 family monovalent cation:H+ antiporter